MKTKQLGNSDMNLTPIGVGAWAIGGSGWAFAWGPQDDDDSIAAIHAALDKGVNWIDTAAVYGLGHSEEVVGRALKGRSNPPFVFTKCERIWNEQRRDRQESQGRFDPARSGGEPAAARRSSAIDLYQIHWPEPDEDIEEGWRTMARAKGRRQGALYRCVEFQRAADEARAGDRTDHVAAAAVFHDFAGDRTSDTAVLRGK